MPPVREELARRARVDVTIEHAGGDVVEDVLFTGTQYPDIGSLVHV
jgi:hypothetical protein